MNWFYCFIGFLSMRYFDVVELCYSESQFDCVLEVVCGFS